MFVCLRQGRHIIGPLTNSIYKWTDGVWVAFYHCAHHPDYGSLMGYYTLDKNEKVNLLSCQSLCVSELILAWCVVLLLPALMIGPITRLALEALVSFSLPLSGESLFFVHPDCLAVHLETSLIYKYIYIYISIITKPWLKKLFSLFLSDDQFTSRPLLSFESFSLSLSLLAALMHYIKSIALWVIRVNVSSVSGQHIGRSFFIIWWS